MIHGRCLAAALVIGCSLQLCHPVAAQTLDDFVAGAARLRVAFLQKSLASISDNAITQAIATPTARQRLFDGLFDENLDPSQTPAWVKVISWDGGVLLSGDTLLKVWESKRKLVSGALAALPPRQRRAVGERIAEAGRALEDYRADRRGIRSAFQDVRDAYALCRGKHDESAQTLKGALYRLAQRARELGDGVGPLTFADRLWHAGGYQLLSVALAVTRDMGPAMDPDLGVAASTAPAPVLQSSLPAGKLEVRTVSELQ